MSKEAHVKVLRKWACVGLSLVSALTKMDLSELEVSVARHKKGVISTYVVRIHLDRPLPHPDIFESTTFSFRIRPPCTRIWWRPAYQSATFLNQLTRVEIFEYAMNRMDAEPGYFLIRERNKIEPGSLLWISCANIVFKMATSTHALLPTFPEESWVLECTCQTRVDGQIRFEYGYMWTWKFLNPERKSCGFKNIQIRVDGAPINVNRLRLLPKAST